MLGTPPGTRRCWEAEAHTDGHTVHPHRETRESGMTGERAAQRTLDTCVARHLRTVLIASGPRKRRDERKGREYVSDRDFKVQSATADPSGRPSCKDDVKYLDTQKANRLLA